MFTRYEDFNQYIKAYPGVVVFVILIVLGQLATYIYGNGPTDLDTAKQFGAIYSEEFDPASYIHLITHMFVQIGGMTHIAMNLTFLIITGPPLERIYGTGRFAAMFLISGICGGLFVLLFSENVIAAGASTACYGLLGIYVGLAIRRKYITWYERRSIWGVFIINILYTLFMPGISIAGHLGGLAGGLVLSFVITAKPDYWKSFFARLVSTLAVSAVIVGAVYTLRYLPSEQQLAVSQKFGETKSEITQSALYSKTADSMDFISAQNNQAVEDINWLNEQYEMIYPSMNNIINYYNASMESENPEADMQAISEEKEQLMKVYEILQDKQMHEDASFSKEILSQLFSNLIYAAELALSSSGTYTTANYEEMTAALENTDAQADAYVQAVEEFYENQNNESFN